MQFLHAKDYRSGYSVTQWQRGLGAKETSTMYIYQRPDAS